MQINDATRVWFHGLVAAGIGAFGNSIGTVLVAPDRFNFSSGIGIRNVIESSLVSAAVSVGLYLKSSPLPPIVKKTQTEKTTTDSDGNETTEKVKTTETVTGGTSAS